MMNKTTVLEHFKSHADPKIEKQLSRHSHTYRVLGVKMKDIRDLAAQIGENHALALELYALNFYETMMLGSIIASPARLTGNLLRDWAKQADSSYIIDQGLVHTILKMESYQPMIASWYLDNDSRIRYAGFVLLSNCFRLAPLDSIDIEISKHALEVISDTIISEDLFIQNAMNNAVVMAGLHVPALVEKAIEIANQIGYILPLAVKNKCNIQSASDYLIRYKDNAAFSRVAKLKSK